MHIYIINSSEWYIYTLNNNYRINQQKYMALLLHRILGVTNSSFPPFNPDVTTDNVAYPLGYAIFMSLVLMFFITCTFNWTWRSIVNMFSEGDYRLKFVPKIPDEIGTVNQEIHPAFLLKNSLWFSYYINPILAMFFSIAILIAVWVEYSSKSNGYFIRNRDAVAILLTAWMGAWLQIMLIIVLRDIRSKHTIAKIAANKNVDNDVRIKALDLIRHFTTLDNFRIMGFLGSTSLSNRRAILMVNAVFWGVTPTAMMMIGILWDRSSAETHNLYTQDLQAYLISFSVCLWTIAFYFYATYCLKYVETYYVNDGYQYSETVFQKLNYDQIKMIQVGITSDTTGTRMPFRGALPYFDLPWHFIRSKIMLGFGLAMIIYNDMSQVLTYFLCCEYIPLLLAKAAGSSAYFLPYQSMAYFFFYSFAYMLTGSFYSWNDQGSINFDLMTVNQSASFPLDSPSIDYGTSVYTIQGITLALAIITALKSWSTPQLPNEDIRIAGSGKHYMRESQPLLNRSNGSRALNDMDDDDMPNRAIDGDFDRFETDENTRRPRLNNGW